MIEKGKIYKHGKVEISAGLPYNTENLVCSCARRQKLTLNAFNTRNSVPHQLLLRNTDFIVFFPLSFTLYIVPDVFSFPRQSHLLPGTTFSFSDEKTGNS